MKMLARCSCELLETGSGARFPEAPYGLLFRFARTYKSRGHSDAHAAWSITDFQSPTPDDFTKSWFRDRQAVSDWGPRCERFEAMFGDRGAPDVRVYAQIKNRL